MNKSQCVKCGKEAELRFGWCFDCVFPPGDPEGDRIRADDRTVEQQILDAGGIIVDNEDDLFRLLKFDN